MDAPWFLFTDIMRNDGYPTAPHPAKQINERWRVEYLGMIVSLESMRSYWSFIHFKDLQHYSNRFRKRERAEHLGESAH